MSAAASLGPEDGATSRAHSAHAPAPEGRESRVAIACAADRRYALPLAVMLRSAADHLGAEATVDAYVLDDRIDPGDRRRVEASLDDRIALHWICGEPADLAGLPLWGRMTATTYRKLTLGRWLPEHVERAIWLDCDVLVLTDLRHLWRADLRGRHALGVRDALVPRLASRFGVGAHRDLGLPGDAEYFNAGVLLTDVAAWRRDDVAGRARDYLRRYADRVFFWDQEALNAVLAGHWGALDARWNWHATGDRLARRAAPPPWILHFSGNLKPWSYAGTSPLHALYYRHLDRTAWRGWRPGRSWRGAMLSAYESSRLRRFFYPAEQLGTRLVRALTLRPAASDGA
ncbi:MAG TPA: glycosyltransferase family 8 protein [Candidatus Binatia bacterium]|nr:glycosyltransferase family 8 protein [Candidatus Binatia bacterium]